MGQSDIGVYHRPRHEHSGRKREFCTRVLLQYRVRFALNHHWFVCIEWASVRLKLRLVCLCVLLIFVDDILLAAVIQRRDDLARTKRETPWHSRGNNIGIHRRKFESFGCTSRGLQSLELLRQLEVSRRYFFRNLSLLLQRLELLSHRITRPRLHQIIILGLHLVLKHICLSNENLC